MSSATLAHDETHDAHEAHHTSFPIDNRKLAIWSFIGSECLFFATLISTFLIYKDNHPKGPGPRFRPRLSRSLPPRAPDQRHRLKETSHQRCPH